jgi:hypothetical protein
MLSRVKSLLGWSSSRGLSNRRQPSAGARRLRRNLELEHLETRLVPAGIAGFNVEVQQAFPDQVQVLNGSFTPPVPNAPTIHLDTIFQDQVENYWANAVAGNIQFQGQTISDYLKAAIQQGEQAQGYSGSDITPMFTSQGRYSGQEIVQKGGVVTGLLMEYDVLNNSVTWTSTTNSPFGNAYFGVTFDIHIAITMPMSSSLSDFAGSQWGVNLSIANAYATYSGPNPLGGAGTSIDQGLIKIQNTFDAFQMPITIPNPLTANPQVSMLIGSWENQGGVL